MTTVDDFAAEARTWLQENAELKTKAADAEPAITWGQGDFSVAVFHNLSHDEEQAVLDEAAAWQQKKAARGYHAITWPAAYGGLDLSDEHEKAFRRLEAEFDTPGGHETFSVTTRLMAPTMRLFGTDEQLERYVEPFLRADLLCCQLFSEPGAGSDLANVGMRADRDGDEWVLNGQKVWSSGAQFSEWGMAVCRSDPDAPKHKGITVFLVPMDAPGVEIRQIRQMSGGTSFNEVFFSDVRVPDTLRVGAEGEGWKVALTVLGFERGSSGGGTSGRVGGNWHQVLALARHLDLTADPVARQALSDLYVHYRLMALNRQRVAAQAEAGQAPGPEGSIGKVFWTQGMTKMSEVVGQLLGPRLAADTGEWGTFEWTEHVLGAPGYRIAGGSDEVQRNIIGERVLGLPGEPRVDKGIPYREVPK